MLFFMSFLDQFFVTFERVWEALWALLVALGALWDDFLVKFLDDIFYYFSFAGSWVPLGLDFASILEGSGIIFSRFWISWQKKCRN